MRDAVDTVAMDLGVEGVEDLAGIAGEDNEAIAGGKFVDGEAVLGEPGGDLGDGLRGGSEADAVLGGGEPGAIERGGWILLGLDEGIELGLLGWGRLKQEDHAVHAGVGAYGAEIEFGAGHGMDVAGEGDGLRLRCGRGQRAGGNHLRGYLRQGAVGRRRERKGSGQIEFSEHLFWFFSLSVRSDLQK